MLSIDVDLILAPQDLGGFGGSIVTNNQYRWVHKPAFFPMVNFQPFNQKIASWNNTSPLSQALDEERMRSIVLASGGPTVHKIIRVQFNTWLREAQHTKFNRDLPKLNPKFNKAILNELDRWKEKDFEIITKKVRNIPFFSDPDLARDLRDRRLIGNDHKLSTRSKSLLSFAKNLGFSRREVEDLSKGEIHVNVNNPYLAPKFRQFFTSIVLLVTYRALLTARIIQKTSMQLVLDRVGLLVYLTSKRVSGLTTFYRS
jgi:hypothetical protein